jgi:hypothetical protein
MPLRILEKKNNPRRNEMIRIEEVWPKEVIQSHEEFANRVICPICGNETFDTWTICPHCEWEHDHSTGYSSANRSYKWVYRLKYRLKRFFKIK